MAIVVVASACGGETSRISEGGGDAAPGDGSVPSSAMGLTDGGAVPTDSDAGAIDATVPPESGAPSSIDATVPPESGAPLSDAAPPGDAEAGAPPGPCTALDPIPSSLRCDRPCTPESAGSLCVPGDCLHTSQPYSPSLCLCESESWQCPACNTSPDCNACGPKFAEACSPDEYKTGGPCYSMELGSRAAEYCVCSLLPYEADGSAVPPDERVTTEAGLPIAPEGGSLQQGWSCSEWPPADGCPVSPPDAGAPCAMGTACFYRIGAMAGTVNLPNVVCACQAGALSCFFDEPPSGGPDVVPGGGCGGFARGVPFWRAIAAAADSSAAPASQRCVCAGGDNPTWQCDAPIACPSSVPTPGDACSPDTLAMLCKYGGASPTQCTCAVDGTWGCQPG
jgi:hypothetical protein